MLGRALPQGAGGRAWSGPARAAPTLPPEGQAAALQIAGLPQPGQDERAGAGGHRRPAAAAPAPHAPGGTRVRPRQDVSRRRTDQSPPLVQRARAYRPLILFCRLLWAMVRLCTVCTERCVFQ